MSKRRRDESLTLATSAFVRHYDRTSAPTSCREILEAVRRLMEEYAARNGYTRDNARDSYRELCANVEDIRHRRELMLHIWTETERFMGAELCGIINQAIRVDRTGTAVVLTRALTSFTNDADIELPDTCYRGGGLPREHRDFFSFSGSIRRYRVPQFLSFSHSRSVARTFARRQSR